MTPLTHRVLTKSPLVTTAVRCSKAGDVLGEATFSPRLHEPRRKPNRITITDNCRPQQSDGLTRRCDQMNHTKERRRFICTANLSEKRLVRVPERATGSTISENVGAEITIWSIHMMESYRCEEWQVTATDAQIRLLEDADVTDQLEICPPLVGPQLGRASRAAPSAATRDPSCAIGSTSEAPCLACLAANRRTAAARARCGRRTLSDLGLALCSPRFARGFPKCPPGVCTSSSRDARPCSNDPRIP